MCLPSGEATRPLKLSPSLPTFLAKPAFGSIVSSGVLIFSRDAFQQGSKPAMGVRQEPSSASRKARSATTARRVCS